MKYFIYVLIVIGLGLIIFNTTKIDFSNPFAGDSAIAAIGIVAAACAILLMVILRSALKVKQRKKN